MKKITLNLHCDITSDECIHYEDMEKELLDSPFYSEGVDEGDWFFEISDTTIFLSESQTKSIQNALLFINNNYSKKIILEFETPPEFQINFRVENFSKFQEIGKKWEDGVSYSSISKYLKSEDVAFCNCFITRDPDIQKGTIQIWIEYSFKGYSDYKTIETEFIPKGEIELLLRKAKIDNLFDAEN